VEPTGHVAEVQITVAEALGVETRGAYYRGGGALRDMMPEYLLSSVPHRDGSGRSPSTPGARHDEKNKVMHAIRPARRAQDRRDRAAGSVRPGLRRGQAGSGLPPGEGRPRRIRGPRPTRRCRLTVDNWRWAGVPFYLRTGKRLAKRVSEIAIRFHRTPHMIFHRAPSA